MATSTSAPRGDVPVHALLLRQRCPTRTRPDEVCSSAHGAYRLFMALTLIWCSSAHGTRICSSPSMVLARRLRGGSHHLKSGNEFGLKMLSSSPSKILNPAEKAVLESDAYIHWCLPIAQSVRNVRAALDIPHFECSSFLPGSCSTLVATTKLGLRAIRSDSSMLAHRMEDHFRRGGQLEQLKERLQVRTPILGNESRDFW